MTKSNGKILVTGAAGFIGFHLCLRLLREHWDVLGVDDLNAYYSPKLKTLRLDQLKQFNNFRFLHLDIKDPSLNNQVKQFAPDFIIHLAAQAGIRYSVTNPEVYLQSNLVGFFNVLEIVKDVRPQHFIYASSSSVYGMSSKVPFSTDDRADWPVSFYAATKRANELMAHSYSHINQIPVTGLRLFTVYGSWGRPDMAYWSFTEKILNGEEITLYHNGQMKRDFTHVSDVVESIIRLIPCFPRAENGMAPARIHNIGASEPIELMSFLDTLADLLKKKPKYCFMPLQPGDVLQTYADVSELEKIIKYKPQVKVKDGLKEFTDWFTKYSYVVLGSE